MAASSSSPHLSPARSSCQIAGRLIPAPRHAPAVRIRSWRRFAASSSEVSLVPARLLRPPSRRRNALREKASQPPPPLAVRHQELDISGGQGASRRVDVASESELDELDVIGDAEELPLRGTGADPAFGFYKDPEGNVMQFEAYEDEIINWNEATMGEGSGDLESMSSWARAMPMELESSERVAPNSSDNSSRFHFAEAERMGSPVLNGEVSVAWSNVPHSRSVTWVGFAALCGICIVFVASKLIRSSSKAQLPRKLFDMHRPEMKEYKFDKGNLNVFRSGQKFPDILLRRPQLDRKELMSNIKKAQDSRKWFVLSNPFRCKDAATYDDTYIPETRINGAEVHTPEEGILEKYSTNEKNGIVIAQSIDAIQEETSASYGSQSDLVEVSDSSESDGIKLSNARIEESREQTVALKNGVQIMNMSEKDQENIGEVELSEPTYGNERVTYTNDKNSAIYASEKETQIGSENVHKSGANNGNTPPSEFASKEQSAEISEKNLDCIQGIEPSVPFISEKLMIYAKDNSQQFSTNVVSEPSDGFSISSSELTKNETPLDNANGINGTQEIDVPRTSANVAHTACSEEFSDDMSIIGTEACKTPVMAETMNAASAQRSKEDPAHLRGDNMQPIQELEPPISSGNGKQLSHAPESEHQERIIHDKRRTRRETDHTGIFNNASAASFCTSQEESVQHTFADVSRSEKKQEKKKPRAHLPKKKGKLQMYSDKEAETEQSEEGKPGTETVVDPTNRVQKTKRVPKKRQKKVQNEMQGVPAHDDVQCSSVVDQKNNSQHVKKARKKNPKKSFLSQGAQTREEYQDTAHVISSPDNATDNMKPLDLADSSVETQFQK
ncbi:hypothetical protein EJB05_51333 [Eragrostis curvula]|uniref:Uncharacterized protein n=1 Tax=Eragrostis curvula TaxID=38414 RepID=A0A5J9SVY2_9POAL|nr:hypothetical protein EJB05_51333 [Eragrostis curvula]